MKKKVIVASKNPVKLTAVKAGFEDMFGKEDYEYHSLSVPSGVEDQPMDNATTLEGAKNRAGNAKEYFPDADFWVGLEGGVEDIDGEMAAFAWIVILSPRLTGKAKTGTFFLPPKVKQLVKQGHELGEADDMVFGQTNSKQNLGAVGLLSDGKLDRAGLYAQAVLLALIPHKNPQFYSDTGDL